MLNLPISSIIIVYILYYYFPKIGLRNETIQNSKVQNLASNNMILSSPNGQQNVLSKNYKQGMIQK